MFLTLLMLVSVVPTNVLAEEADTPRVSSVMENTNQSEGIVVSKGVTLNADGTVNVTIEAYTTGTVTSTSRAVPADIVLVLDVSGSMKDSATSYYTTTYSEVYARKISQGKKQNKTEYYGFSNRNTTYYISVGDEYEPVTYAGTDRNGYDYYSYYNDAGTLTYVYPTLQQGTGNANRQYNYFVVTFLEQKSTAVSTETKLAVLQRSVNAFLETTRQKNAEIASTSDQHRVALVKFGSADYYNDSNKLAEGSHTMQNGYNYTEVVNGLTTDMNALKTKVSALTSGGATAVDYGVTLANELLAAQRSTANYSRNQVVIVFSDGSPTHSNGFETNAADSALSTSATMKGNQVKVYTISVASGADATQLGNDSTNKFMHYLSSNYPSVVNMSPSAATLAAGSPTAGYYMTPDSSTSLEMLFTAIAETIAAPTIELGATATLIDTMSDYFTIPGVNGTGNANITLQTADMQADGEWAEAVAATGVTATLVDNNTVTVSGFNFDENYVSATARTVNGAAFYGRKLILTMTAAPDYEEIDAETAAIAAAQGWLDTNKGSAKVVNAGGTTVAEVSTPSVLANAVTYYTAYGDGTPQQYGQVYYRLPGVTVETIAEPTAAGYTFGGWESKLATIEGGSFTMPSYDVDIYGQFTAKTYTVEYRYTVAPEGAPALPETKAYAYGTKDIAVAEQPTLAGYTFHGWAVESPAGLDISGGSFDLPASNVVLYGYFEPETDTAYRVEHYLQTLDADGEPIDSYQIVEKDTKVYKGTTGTTVAATPNPYVGYTYNAGKSTATGVIAGNDSLVLKLYYDLDENQKFTVTYEYDTAYGVTPAGAPALPAQSSYYVGQTVTVAADAVMEGYHFVGWYEHHAVELTSFTMPANHVVLKGYFVPNTDTHYKVEHYLQSADLTSYELQYTEAALHGTTGETVTAKPMTDDAKWNLAGKFVYDPMHTDAVPEGVVAADGSLVLKLYYNRVTYAVSYVYTGEVPGDATALPETESYAYGQTVRVADRATATGYYFHGWLDQSTNSLVVGAFTMPASDVTLYGYFDANDDTRYQIEHYLQQLDAEGKPSSAYTRADHSFHEGTTGAEAVATPNQYDGYTYNATISTASGTIAADGSLILKLYYDFTQLYTVTYAVVGSADPLAGPQGAVDVPSTLYTLPDGGSYYVGQTVTVAADLAVQGYHFVGWWEYEAGYPSAVKSSDTSFVMPARNLTLKGYFIAGDNTKYTVEHYFQTVDGSEYVLDNTYTQEKYGKTGASVTAEPLSAADLGGKFTYNDAKSGATKAGDILADGSLVLKLYYDRAAYTVTYAYTGTVPDGANPTAATLATWTKKYVYGEMVSVADKATAVGCHFHGWANASTGVTVSGSFTMPAHDVTLQGAFEQLAVNEYRVEYYLQTRESAGSDTPGYKLDSWHTHAVTFAVDQTSVDVEVHSKPDYAGYVLNTAKNSDWTGTVTKNGTTVVLKVYYDLVPYNVTYAYDGAQPVGAPEIPAEYAHKAYIGDTVTIRADLVLAGYTFDGWRSTNPAVGAADVTFIMPAHDVTLVGKFSVKTGVTYEVRHYQMNLDGSYSDGGASSGTYDASKDSPTKTERIETGYTGQKVVADLIEEWIKQGFNHDDKNLWHGTIPAEGELILRVYYSREPEHRVYYHYYDNVPAGAPALPADSNSYRFGAAVNVMQPGEFTGYAFDGWHSAEVGTYAPGAAFEMPQLGNGKDVHFYGTYTQKTEQTYTVTYLIDGVQYGEIENLKAGESHTVRATPADTDTHTFVGWTLPTTVAAVNGMFTMPAQNVVINGTWKEKELPPAPKTYTVTYYLNNQQYAQFTLTEGSTHTILGQPTLGLGMIFSGWSHPKTVSGAYVMVSGSSFTMPAADVVMSGTTNYMPIVDGVLKIKKVVEAPEGFNGGNTYTFNIYTVEADGSRTLVKVAYVTVDPYTGRGDSGNLKLPKGGNYLVEEVGAQVTGYSLETVITNAYNQVMAADETIRVTQMLDPTVITFTNTYAELPLETDDHFGYIIGYPDGMVRPLGNITRAEVATIFFRLMTDESRAQYWAKTNSFVDVMPGDWYNNAVSTLTNAGILNGYGDGSFRPGNPITRAELVKIAMSFYGVTGSSGSAFSDVSEHWAADFINAAAEMGFVSGYGDGTFHPDQLVTRAEAMKIINRTLGRKPHKDFLLDDMIVWADNMDTEAWYYAEVQEATNSHAYIDVELHEIWENILAIRDWAALEKRWSEANDGAN